MRKIYLVGLLIFVSLNLCTFSVSAQQAASFFNEFILNRWIKNEPITTSFQDAVKYSELADNFGNGQKFRAMHRQPRSANNAFVLRPGFYELKSRSYCLRAGTHGPSSGDGYLFAPLLGRQKDIVQEILTRSEAHSEIDQKDVQVLLWAIIARCDFQSMNSQMVSVAQRLMKPKHMARLNKGVILDLALNAINSPQLTASVRSVLQTENQIRNLVGQSHSSFQDLERLAVLAGPARVDNPEYRRGRWAKHPDGYYVRYFPQNYSHTIVQVYVPESVSKVEFDATNDVAVPANTGAQRLGLSNVPYDTTGYEPETPPVIAQNYPVEPPKTKPEVKPQTAPSRPTPPTSTSSVQKPVTPPAMRSLCGKVVDVRTGKTIARATITTKGQTLTADDRGQFIIPDLRPEQELSLTAGAEAYENSTMEVRIEARKDCQPITISLQPIAKPQSSTAIALEERTIREGERFIMDNIHFEQSESELLPEGRAELDKVASWMKNHESIKIELAGHTTDEGEHKLNVELSKKRAIACKKYLMQKGIKSKRISTNGFGPDKPIVPQGSAEKALNRRVEMTVTQA